MDKFCRGGFPKFGNACCRFSQPWKHLAAAGLLPPKTGAGESLGARTEYRMSGKKKGRMCSALNRTITSAECGASRNTQHGCPATCVHNPFNPEHYEQALAIEDALFQKVLDRLAAELGPALPAPPTRREEELAGFVQMVRARFFDRDATDRTFAERWRTAGYAELSNDERVLFEGQSQLRVVLLEIQQITGPEQCLAVDRLTPTAPPLLIQDRSLADAAVRFASYVGWAFPQPHYWRLHGVVTAVPECQPLEATVVLQQVVRHLGGPKEGEPLQNWLAANFVRVNQALYALAEGLEQRTWAQLDARFHTVTYRLRVPDAEMRRRLAALPALVPQKPDPKEQQAGYTHAWAWVDEAPAAAPNVLANLRGRPTLGSVLLAPGRLCLEAGVGERVALLRAQFERWFGGDMEFVGERMDNVARQLALQHPPRYDAALVPPALLNYAPSFQFNISLVNNPKQSAVNADALQREVLTANVAEYADLAIPALNGRTPREAACDPALHPKLVALMKGFVRCHDRECRRLGMNVDLNNLLRELGLTELDFPPPPERPLTKQTSARDEPIHDSMLSVDTRSWAPPLPIEPLSEEDVVARFEHAAKKFEHPTDLVEACNTSSNGLIDLMDEFIGTWPDQDVAALLTAVGLVWFAVFPPEYRPQSLDIAQLEAAIDHGLAQSDELSFRDVSRAAGDFMTTPQQPNLFACAALAIMDGRRRSKKAKAKYWQVQLDSLTILRTVVNELDRVAH